VQELARRFEISDQTVRRIVKPLAEKGRLRKVHGAIVSTDNPGDPPFMARMNLARQAKAAIADAVASIVRDGDSLAIDTGSTSGFVALSLRARRRLTVVTNSAFIASTLAMVEGNRVFMAGSQLRDHDGAAFDRSTFAVIERMRVDYALLSASFVDPELGFLVHEKCEVDVASAMKASANRCMMAVDHTKFSSRQRRPHFRQPPPSPGDLVVTDRDPGPTFSRLLESLELHVAGPAISRRRAQAQNGME
ncbi:MAG: DeoR/GlpR family DNA-binding transcription regulator, partial [Geminicoccaceae bacterium]